MSVAARSKYLFIICLDYVLRTPIDKIRENGFELTKKRRRRYPAKTITDADYADDVAILANTPDQAETLLQIKSYFDSTVEKFKIFADRQPFQYFN